MDRQYGMADFFAMEAGEYLERLDALVSAPNPPNGEDLQRLTRALRGAALMANQQPIAAAAGAFEHLARAVREGRQEWDEGTRQLAIRTVDDLKTFVRHAREWSDADTARARDVAATLERAGGRPAAPRRSASTLAPDAGTRAFVAREGAALASGLARVAEAISHNPAVTDPVQGLLRQMQPLRGLATLAEYPPLPDLLDGIERAAALVARAGGALADPGALLDAAARALTHATRDITTSGRADPDAVEVRRFAGALRAAMGLDRPDVPIEQLFAADGPHIVEERPRSAGPRLGKVELTALGEHLKQVGIGVAGAGSGPQRELRVLALVEPLHALEAGVDDTLRDPMRGFARACRDAIAASVVDEQWEPLGHAVQEAGVAVAAGSATALERLTGQIQTLVTPAAAPAPAVRAAPRAPAPAAPPPTVAPTPPAAPVAPEPGVHERETADLVGSMIRYHRFVQTLGLDSPSLATLLAGPPADPVAGPPAPEAAAPAAVPAAAPTPPPAEPLRPAPAPPPVAAPASAEEAPVPIATLCYSGKDALDRALSLREQITTMVAEGAPAQTVQELLEEVFDLVRLGSADVA